MDYILKGFWGFGVYNALAAAASGTGTAVRTGPPNQHED